MKRKREKGKVRVHENGHEKAAPDGGALFGLAGLT